MVRNVTEALAAARVTTTNSPGMCQKTTRMWFNVGSAGDRDNDGDADAVDGWLSEPKRYRHTDRNVPIGAPIAWSGGSGGFGHRAIMFTSTLVRSTDAGGDSRTNKGGRGKVGNRTLEWFEKTWGLTYLGWSETMSGVLIPGLVLPDAARPSNKQSRGAVVDRIIIDLKSNVKHGTGARAKQLKLAAEALSKVPYLD